MKYLKLFEQYIKYFEGKSFEVEHSKNFRDVIKYILEDDSLTTDYRNVVISSITELPDKYRTKVYADRVVYLKDIDSRVEPAKAGEKKLGTLGISDVGKYWEHSDLPELIEYFKPYNLNIEYCHEYRYVILLAGDGLDKRLEDVANKYNL